MENLRLVFTVTREMHQALKRQAARRGATLAGLVRLILGEWLEQHGEKIEWQVEWGGTRKEGGEDSSKP